MNKRNIILLSFITIAILLLLTTIVSYSFIFSNEEQDVTDKKIESNVKKTTPVVDNKKYTNIILNAIGDCTIGYDENFGYTYSFNEVIEKNGYDFIFSNVKELFEKDDLTIANLEGTFTDQTLRKEKAFNFKGPKDYVNILKNGSIDVVNLANNHSHDYFEVGYNDTILTLNDANINYFGNDDYYVYEKDDIKVGFAGIFCIEDWSCTKKIDSSIKYLQEKNVDLIILSFHWGIEKSYVQSNIQEYLAHYAIDNGVELVLGHHPHVLQGIELYKDKYIVYSLANFAFGGNKNPSDKDTMIFNINFSFVDNKLKDTIVNVYPASVSSVKNINNYSPIILEGEEYDRVLEKIQLNSVGINLK